MGKKFSPGSSYTHFVGPFIVECLCVFAILTFLGGVVWDDSEDDDDSDEVAERLCVVLLTFLGRVFSDDEDDSDEDDTEEEEEDSDEVDSASDELSSLRRAGAFFPMLFGTDDG